MHAQDNKAGGQEGPVPAVVMGLGTIGLAVARSLGQMGVPVIGVDKSKLSVGMYSRHCKGLICPDLVRDETGYVQFLKGLAPPSGVRPVLIPTRDQEVALAARHKAELAGSFRFPWADDALISRLVDKKKFYGLIKDMDVDCPATYVPEDATHAAEISREIPYPCIVKPVDTIPFSTRFSVKCFPARDAGELLAGYDKASRSGHEVIFQEVIPGDDRCLYMVGGYFDRNSEPHGAVIHRKIRSAPAAFGIGSLVESWQEPEVLDKGVAFLRDIHFHGIGMVEYKRDPRDGRFKVIEVNSRPWTQTWLATRSGVNLPYLAYRDAIGEPLAKVTTYAAGLKWLCMSEDFRSCLTRYRGGTMGPVEYVKSLKGIQVYSIMDLSDPLPFLMTPVQLGNGSLRYLMKKARLRRNELPVLQKGNARPKV